MIFNSFYHCSTLLNEFKTDVEISANYLLVICEWKLISFFIKLNTRLWNAGYHSLFVLFFEGSGRGVVTEGFTLSYILRHFFK